MRLGVFGGSFDPVHYGHLLLAECCREQCRLSSVRLLPADVPPHKQRRKPTPARHRIEMLRLAVGGHESLVAATEEIDRGGVSYTVDTLAAIRRAHPEAELFLLVGADSLHDLPTWRQARRVCELALPMVVRRAGWPEADFGEIARIVAPERLEEIRRHQVEMPLIGLSSSDIRRRVAAGQSIRYRTPRAVEEYIRAHGLYRSACSCT